MVDLSPRPNPTPLLRRCFAYLQFCAARMWEELLLARGTLASRCKRVIMKSPYVQFFEIPGVQEQLRWQFLQDVVAQVSVN